MLVERIEQHASTMGETESPCKLLIADDQSHILEALRLLLKPEGYQLEMVRMLCARLYSRRWRTRDSMAY